MLFFAWFHRYYRKDDPPTLGKADLHLTFCYDTFIFVSYPLTLTKTQKLLQNTNPQKI